MPSILLLVMEGPDSPFHSRHRRRSGCRCHSRRLYTRTVDAFDVVLTVRVVVVNVVLIVISVVVVIPDVVVTISVVFVVIPDFAVLVIGVVLVNMDALIHTNFGVSDIN